MNPWQDLFLKILEKNFDLRKQKNPRFSMRSYAKKIGLSPGALSEILKGKRQLRSDRALKILETLEVSNKDLVQFKNKIGIKIQIHRSKHEADKMDFLFDWVSHAVLGFFEIDNKIIDARWISKKIGQPLRAVETRIEQFIERGLLERQKDGRVVMPKRGRLWTVPPEVSEENKHRFYVEQNRLARHALEHGPIEKGFYKSTTFVGSQAQIEIFKEEIIELFDRISASVDPDSQQELMRISVQAFPFEFKK